MKGKTTFQGSRNPQNEKTITYSLCRVIFGKNCNAQRVSLELFVWGDKRKTFDHRILYINGKVKNYFAIKKVLRPFYDILFFFSPSWRKSGSSHARFMLWL